MVKALDYFQEKGWIELESKQMTEVYSLLRSDFDPQALSTELHDYFAHHEATEVARIHAMLEVFSSDQCLTHRLALYFGDHNAPEQCGHCSVCHAKSPICQSRLLWNLWRTGTFSNCVATLSTSTKTTPASRQALNA